VAAAAEGGGAAGAELWTQAGASGVQVEPIKLKNACNPMFRIRIQVDRIGLFKKSISHFAEGQMIIT